MGGCSKVGQTEDEGDVIVISNRTWNDEMKGKYKTEIGKTNLFIRAHCLSTYLFMVYVY